MHKVLETQPGRWLVGPPSSNADLTIAIPTFNRPDKLARAVRSALQQQNYPVQVIIVDNGGGCSWPQAQSLLPSSGWAYFVNQSNLGMVGNWNQCLALTKTKWITILHDDDSLAPTFAASLMKEIHRHQADAGACYAHVGPTEPEWTKLPIRTKQSRWFKSRELILQSLSPFPGVILDTAKAINLGGFNRSWFPCSDYEFWFRYCRQYRLIFVRQALAFYEQSDQQGTYGLTKKMVEISHRLEYRIARSHGIPVKLAKILASLGADSLRQQYAFAYGEPSRTLSPFLRQAEIWRDKVLRLALRLWPC